MTIVQFLSAMERYSMDVLALAFVVCMITSMVKKAIPQTLKKYLTFIPFLAGIVVYAVYMHFNKAPFGEIFMPYTALKGFECGAAATIYYVLYEQFIRGKPAQVGGSVKTVTVAALLKGFVREDAIKSLSEYLANAVIDDGHYSISLCASALKGKTVPGIDDADIQLMANLVVKTLGIL